MICNLGAKSISGEMKEMGKVLKVVGIDKVGVTPLGETVLKLTVRRWLKIGCHLS
jgi:hypothetical protein